MAPEGVERPAHVCVACGGDSPDEPAIEVAEGGSEPSVQCPACGGVAKARLNKSSWRLDPGMGYRCAAGECGTYLLPNGSVDAAAGETTTTTASREADLREKVKSFYGIDSATIRRVEIVNADLIISADADVGRLIGRGGSRVKQLQRELGLRVRIVKVDMRTPRFG